MRYKIPARSMRSRRNAEAYLLGFLEGLVNAGGADAIVSAAWDLSFMVRQIQAKWEKKP